ncbi:MAG: tail fiber domain-containing protein [Nitrospiraceae bacterium]
MKRRLPADRRHRVFRWLTTLGLLGSLSAPVRANELWVPPAMKDQDKTVGNWAVAKIGGETHFSFRVPDDLQEFKEAAVVVIPPRNGELTYNLRISKTTEGMRHDEATENLLTRATLPLTKGQLTEIPVTEAFQAVGGVAAKDYVSLNFELARKGRKDGDDDDEKDKKDEKDKRDRKDGKDDRDDKGATLVVGLRVQYAATGGGVNSVTAGDSSITIGGTATDPTVAVSGSGITADKIADNAVTGTKVADGSLTGADIQDGSIGTADLANSALTINAGVGIAGGGTVQLGGSTTLTNVGVLSVTTSAPLSSSGGQNPNISLGAITGAHVLDNSLTGADIADESLTAGDIGPSAIGNAELANDAVTSAKVADESLTAADMQNILILPSNTAIGSNALPRNTADFNTASGAQALSNNTTGHRNTASGYAALQRNITGCCNTASGVDTLQFNVTGGHNTASGVGALLFNTADFNTASGSGALNNNTTGGSNTASGYFTLRSNTTGSNNTGLGAEADVVAGNLTNATAIGAQALVDASNKIRLGNGAVTLVETHGDLRVGAGTAVGCVQDGDGTVIAGACLSDAKLKTDIRPFAPFLDKLVQLQPVYFRWKPEEDPELQLGAATSFGLIAQEVEKLLPELVTENERGYKVVRYHLLPLLLLQALKEQQELLHRQQTENAALKSRLERVERLTVSSAIAVRAE